jgi:hypothetical protein
MTEAQPTTAPTQKAGFRVPKTVLLLIIRQLADFKSSFVVEVPPIAKLHSKIKSKFLS